MRRIFHVADVIAVGTALPVGLGGIESTTCLVVIRGVLLDQPVVFALQAAREFEKKHKADDADA